MISLERTLRRASTRQRHDAEIRARSDRREPEALYPVAQASQLDCIIDPDIGRIGHD
jgi:hypothetical protein